MKRIPEPIVYALWGGAAVSFAWGGLWIASACCIACAGLYAYANRSRPGS